MIVSFDLMSESDRFSLSTGRTRPCHARSMQQRDRAEFAERVRGMRSCGLLAKTLTREHFRCNKDQYRAPGPIVPEPGRSECSTHVGKDWK